MSPTDEGRAAGGTPAARPEPCRDDVAAAAHRIVAALEALEPERLAFSPADVRERVRFAGVLAETGLAVRIDDAGNVLGRLEGAEPGLDPIVVGSHLDTVSGPGRYDGALGVLCALECARSVVASGAPLRHPLVVAALSDEEGTATGCCWGARTLIDRLSEAERRALASDDSPFAAALAAAADEFGGFGWDVRPGRLLTEAAVPFAAAGYLELHIELGPALTPSGPAVAAISSIAGVERFAVVFAGHRGHPSTVPFATRDDAVVRAAGFIERYWSMAAGFASRAIFNIGRIDAVPGDFNVIPEAARVYIEQRSPDPELLAELEERLRELAAEGRGEVEVLMRSCPIDLDPGLRLVMLAAAAGHGIECPELPAWAGHDAEEFIAVCPAAMVSVRNSGGVSHCPLEHADEPDIAVGLELLLATLRDADVVLQ